MKFDEDNQLQLDIAMVTSKGLHFNGNIYTNATMIKNKWFEQAEREGIWQIPILFWRSNQDSLILFESGSYIIATSVENNLCPSETLEIYQKQLRALKERYFEKKKKH
ncbi:hypothetical protein M5X11_38265 [Paenibacillus alginolyticus]|uniref:hypothetical protein n=1 Tax=Paenibacillus alginolyticus TaxID=59839 RepID=UPI0003FB2482|nr:hypothetical protein [Paenibacillus alginolyticus]MCY9670671.1 hypothetical protein [Paenibacillus alginolyticus]